MRAEIREAQWPWLKSFDLSAQVAQWAFLMLYLSRSTEHGSLVFEVRLGDVMDLICPFYDEEQSYLTSKLEQYDIYRVRDWMVLQHDSRSIPFLGYLERIRKM